MAGKEVQGEFEPECLGPCGAQDTFHVGTLKGVGRQTFIENYAKVGFAKLHDRKTPNYRRRSRIGRVFPFHVENGALPPRVLADRGTE